MNTFQDIAHCRVSVTEKSHLSKLTCCCRSVLTVLTQFIEQVVIINCNTCPYLKLSLTLFLKATLNMLFFFFRTVAFHFIYSSIAICYQVCFNCEQLCFDLSGLVVGVELNGLVHFYFRVLIVLTVIHMGSVLMLIPKKACTYCKSVPLCEFVCMHAQNFVYMRAFACFFALMCVVFAV